MRRPAHSDEDVVLAVVLPREGVGDTCVTLRSTVVLVCHLLIDNVVGRVLGRLPVGPVVRRCAGGGDCVCRQVGRGVTRPGTLGYLVVDDIAARLAGLLLPLGFLAVGQRAGSQGDPTIFLGRLAPVLVVVGRVAVCLALARRRCRRVAVRRGAFHALGALGLFAALALAEPHRLRHPMQVTAVNEDTGAATSVEADRLTTVEDEWHQGHADHLGGIEGVPHLGKRLGANVSRIHEAVVDPLDRELLDRQADDRLLLGGDVLAHLVVHLLVREVGLVEDLDCKGIGAPDLVIDDLVRRSELEDVVPGEAREGRPSIDAVDVPLVVVTHALH